MAKTRFGTDVGIGHDVLICPGCGGDTLHQWEVQIWQRAREDEPAVLTIAADCTTTVVGRPVATSHNPSMRRDGLTIKFTCEQCHREPLLAIWQHKGSTYVEWKQ